MTAIGTDWRVIDDVATAWFTGPSLIRSAALAERIAALSVDAAVDLRVNGLRVRLDSAEHTEAVSAAARDLGLDADPAVPQQLNVVVESVNPTALQNFWQGILDYAAADGGIADPLRRDPTLRIRQEPEPRPLRGRIHLDVVRPAAAVEQTGLGEASGPYGVRHADADGNEVDVVPGEVLGSTAETADWQAVFSAMACYRVSSAAQQRELATTAAALADHAGFPLLIDLRPGLIILDSGKDQWESDAHGIGVDFLDLAAQLETAARDLGAIADAELPRFVQVFVDAADVEAVREFWVAALGYVSDRRPAVSDIYDPYRLNPVLVFQSLDPAENERRRQRNRIHVELAVPADLAPERVAAAVAAGGRLLDESVDRRRITDPEGNELVIVTGA